MAEYGISVRNQRGKMMDISAGLRMARIVFNGDVRVAGGDTETYVPLDISDGSSVGVMPVHVYYPFSNLGCNGWAQEGKGVRFYHDRWPSSGGFDVTIYEITGATVASDYGILLQDSTQLTTIGAKQLSYITHMEELTFTGNWRIPDNVEGRDSAVIFASWSGGDDVGLIRNGDHIEGWREIGREATQDGISMPMRIVVASNVPSLTRQDYGIEVYNTAGELTFTTGYTPLIYQSIRNFNGDSSFNAGIARPMVPVFQFGIDGRNWGNYGTIYNVGIGMNVAGDIFGKFSSVYQSGSTSVINMRRILFNTSMLVLDSDRYF